MWNGGVKCGEIISSNVFASFSSIELCNSNVYFIRVIYDPHWIDAMVRIVPFTHNPMLFLNKF